MHKTIISDTSCLIILSNIEELELLNKIYGTVVTTPEIADEYGDVLPTWIEIVAVTNKSSQQLLEIQIDKGESSALALAMEMQSSIVILDDQKARKIAHLLGITVTGTIGVIVKAKQSGFISSVKPIFEKLKKMNFRMSKEIEQLALKAAGE